MDYAEDWGAVFRQVSGVLEKGGFFIFSIGNPVAEVTKKVDQKRSFVREFRNYFLEKKQYGIWRFTSPKKENIELKIPAYHKTYETIIKEIVRNGFEIVDYKDCFPSKESKKIWPKYYRYLSRIPFFCVWEVKKK